MKKFTGKVVSTKNKNTAIIEVARFKVHPIYEKRTKVTARYAVHDLIGVAVGQNVEFAETKPYSKTKKWIITQVIGAKGMEVKQNQRKSAPNLRKSKI